MIDYAILGFAALNVAIQLVDWHTTSEVLKYGIGYESSKVLGWLLNTKEEHAKKFWRLAAIKLGCIALICMIAWFGVERTTYPVVSLALLIGIAAWYAPIMVSNWKIWKGKA